MIFSVTCQPSGLQQGRHSTIRSEFQLRAVSGDFFFPPHCTSGVSSPEAFFLPPHSTRATKSASEDFFFPPHCTSGASSPEAFFLPPHSTSTTVPSSFLGTSATAESCRTVFNSTGTTAATMGSVVPTCCGRSPEASSPHPNFFFPPQATNTCASDGAMASFGSVSDTNSGTTCSVGSVVTGTGMPSATNTTASTTVACNSLRTSRHISTAS